MSYSWTECYEKTGKWKRLEAEIRNPADLISKVKSVNFLLYDKMMKAGAKEILKEHWYHTVELAKDCIIPGTFDMSKHLKEMNFPLDFAGKNCLDIGCADGFITCEIAKRGGNVTAIDAWPMMIKHVEFLSKIFDVSDKVSTFTCDFHDERFTTEKKYDVIVAMHVLCHHSNEGKDLMLDKIEQILAVDGIFLSCDSDPKVQKLLEKRFNIKKLGQTKLPGNNGSGMSVLFECKKKIL